MLRWILAWGEAYDENIVSVAAKPVVDALLGGNRQSEPWVDVTMKSATI